MKSLVAVGSKQANMNDSVRDDRSSGNLVDFNEVVQELRMEMAEKEGDIAELYYRVYCFGDGNQDNEGQEEVPMIFKARLTQLDTRQRTKHQLLTLTDVSLVSLRTKKHQEKDFQNLLVGTLGHER